MPFFDTCLASHDRFIDSYKILIGDGFHVVHFTKAPKL